MSKKGRTLLESYESMIKMPGYELSLRINRMKDSYYILDENYRQIIEFVDDFQGNFDPVRYRDLFRADNQEVKRLLHNYSASVFSLLNHMGKITSEDKTHNLSDIYKEQIKIYKSHDIRQFIIRLRVFIQHIDLINPSTHYSFRVRADTDDDVNLRTDTIIKIELNRDELLKWDHWKSQGKRFLQNSPETIHLKKVLIQHKIIIDNLYNNTLSKIILQYEKDVDEFNEKLMELDKLRREMNI